MIVVDFKVGDRVRRIGTGDEHTVSDVAYRTDHECWYVYVDGDTRDDRGGNDPEEFELVDPTVELAVLRAFKETALASGYKPPESPKPETDGEAAERFNGEWWSAESGSEIPVWLEAFAWARANPR